MRRGKDADTQGSGRLECRKRKLNAIEEQYRKGAYTNPKLIIVSVPVTCSSPIGIARGP